MAYFCDEYSYPVFYCHYLKKSLDFLNQKLALSVTNLNIGHDQMRFVGRKQKRSSIQNVVRRKRDARLASPAEGRDLRVKARRKFVSHEQLCAKTKISLILSIRIKCFEIFNSFILSASYSYTIHISYTHLKT